jgi:hypothetical protein
MSSDLSVSCHAQRAPHTVTTTAAATATTGSATAALTLLRTCQNERASRATAATAATAASATVAAVINVNTSSDLGVIGVSTGIDGTAALSERDVVTGGLIHINECVTCYTKQNNHYSNLHHSLCCTDSKGIPITKYIWGLCYIDLALRDDAPECGS